MTTPAHHDPAEQAHIDVRLERRSSRRRPQSMKELRRNLESDDAAARKAHLDVHHPTHTDKGRTYRIERPMTPTQRVLGAGESVGGILDTCTYVDCSDEDRYRARAKAAGMRVVDHPVRVKSTVTTVPLKESFMARVDADRGRAPRSYLTPAEVGSLLELSHDTIGNLIEAGRLHAYRPGGQYGTRRISIDIFMAYVRAECNMLPAQIAALEEQVHALVMAPVVTSS